MGRRRALLAAFWPLGSYSRERLDFDGKTWEIFTSGYRNPYDFAFNADGGDRSFTTRTWSGTMGCQVVPPNAK